MTQSTRPHSAVIHDRIAAIYDGYAVHLDAFGGHRARRRLFGQAAGQVLELGVGTGLNLPYYPDGVHLTGIDISPRMLDRAHRRADRLDVDVKLELADIEELPYFDSSFDTVTAACVFCSVSDPIRGLSEAARVLRPNGRLLLYEHVRPRNPLLGRLSDIVSPLTRRLMGPELNRRTEENLGAAGLHIVEMRRRGVWREIVAVRCRHGV